MAALYMQGNGGSSSSYLYNNGASSSNSSASEPSSTKGVITSTPLPQQIPFIPQSQMGQLCIFQIIIHLAQVLVLLVIWIIHMTIQGNINLHHNKGSTMVDSQGENNNYKQEFKGKGSNYKNNSGWTGNTESKTILHPECQICQ